MAPLGDTDGNPASNSRTRCATNLDPGARGLHAVCVRSETGIVSVAVTKSFSGLRQFEQRKHGERHRGDEKRKKQARLETDFDFQMNETSRFLMTFNVNNVFKHDLNYTGQLFSNLRNIYD